MKIPVLFLSLLSVIPTFAQQQNAAPPNVVESQNGANLPMQRVGPEDLLSLQVYDAPEFTRSVRVSGEGTIRLPMMRSPLRVQGLFPNEIEALLTDALKREGLFIDPYVTVNISEYHSRPINVTGAVRVPTIFQAVGSVRLLDALARAGGIVTENAGPDIVVTRPNGGSDQSVQRIPTKALMEGLDPELNLKLTGGEEIRVPEVGKIVVQGSVMKPGVYPVLDPIANNTVSTAIAQAGGLAQFADHQAYIFRVDEKGNKFQIPVPLWDIINRKKPDMVLQAKDILQVPDSPKRRITQTTIQSLTGVGAASATALVYKR